MRTKLGAGLSATLLMVSVLSAHDIRAQPPAPSVSASASTSASARTTAPAPPAPTSPPAVSDPAVQRLQDLTRQIRALIDDELDQPLDPAAFQIDLADEPAARLERRRLRAIVTGHDGAGRGGEGGGGRDGDGGGGRGGATPEDGELWRAQLDLDRARLTFLELKPKERKARLDALAQRLRTDEAAETEKELSDAEKKAKTAEKERQRLIEAAKTARSEAERLLKSEQARLLAVEAKQAEREAELIKQKKANLALREDLLVWQRKVDEWLDAANTRPSSNARDREGDALYEALRDSLRKARDDLAASLSRGRTKLDVPDAGADRLVNLPQGVDRSEVDTVRKRVSAGAEDLRALGGEVAEERSKALMSQVTTLNRLRLKLLPSVSSGKRSALTGFGPRALEQAGAEGRQVLLTLRYHLAATTKWVDALRNGAQRGESLYTALGLLFRWLLPVIAFIWWRRRVPPQLVVWRDEMRAATTKRRRATPEPSWVERVLSFLIRVRGPLEWLLLLWSVFWLLPEAIGKHLVVKLLATIFVWTLSGSLVVRIIDALSSNDVLGRGRSAAPNAELRLRSLRLIGRTVVVLGLLLSLSDELVGKGTIYTWVLTACYVLAAPVLLVVIKWWQPVIFERIDEVRKPNPFEAWVLRRQKGAMSFVAAVAGGAYLFVVGAWQALNRWAVTFNVTRRLLAYFFRRGMNKKAERVTSNFTRVPEELFESLGPEAPSDDNVPSVADEQIEDIMAHITRPGGGVFAIVGERGAGKSTITRRIVATREDVVTIDCPVGGIEAFKRALNASVGLAADAPLEEATRILDGNVADAALLIDDAHHLILPKMGGLQDFDQVLELARNNSENCTWVFAVDEVIWRFFELARGAKPMFDAVIKLEPWSEEGIVRLLEHRNEQTSIAPSFEHLLGDLPEDADEIDLKEAIETTKESYFRLLWDYAAGNPGVALHFWRQSLGVDEDGELSVRLFTAPDPEELDGLPDSAVFVLRAIVQLGWAEISEIVSATSLSRSEVQDALRYGWVRGYFDRTAGRYHITWQWFRAITRLLQRRHLIFSQT